MANEGQRDRARRVQQAPMEEQARQDRRATGPREEADASEVEDVERQEPVRRALQRTAPPGAGQEAPPKRPIATRHKVWIAFYAAVLLLLAGVRYVLRLDLVPILGRFDPPAQRVTVGLMWIVLVMAVYRAVDAFLIDPMDDDVTRYNLRRILRLVEAIVIFFIVLSMLFANWYTAVVSLGLISLVLGFALQTPITSFIGWIYILVREPYRVGDRIQIGTATGDVIDVSYLDTTLWEFGGPYVSTDHPSGRVIKFPNSQVLNTAVYNYSWPVFPYIWNEVSFQVAYESDLDFVAQMMREEVASELGPQMMHRIDIYRQILAQTPVDQIQVQEHPVILFHVSSNTWIEAVARYLVDPRSAGSVKSRLTRKILARMNTAKDRVQFPQGDNR